MDPERTLDLNPKPASAKAEKPASKAESAPRIEPTLKSEPRAFKPETAADAWLGLLDNTDFTGLPADGVVH